jgi:arylsulfatase A-like enzyme
MTAIERVKDRPFSITCSFQHPHPPMVVPRPYYGMYPFEQLEPPISIKDSMHNSPYRELASKMKRFKNKDYVRQMTSTYYGLISEIDYWIGQILEKLKSLNLEENTLVVFTSDHGDMMGAHGMGWKRVFYEESVHVPLIMRLPGVIPAETVVSKPVSHIDLFPTILDYVGIVGHSSEGRSLRSLIEKTGSDGLDYCCSECFRRNAPTLMVRTNRWKFLFAHSARSLSINALYNLEEDPHEMNNLIGKNPNKSAFVRKAEEMKARLVEWLEHIESAHIEGVKARSV